MPLFGIVLISIYSVLSNHIVVGCLATSLLQVEEKPDVTYSDVGGCKEQIEKLREVVETPLLHPERFVNLGIEPPKVGDGGGSCNAILHYLVN